MELGNPLTTYQNCLTGMAKIKNNLVIHEARCVRYLIRTHIQDGLWDPLGASSFNYIFHRAFKNEFR